MDGLKYIVKSIILKGVSPRRLIRVSRPRFWIYTFGPFIVGALVGAPAPRDYFSPLALAWAFFFLFPANLLIYGVNDIFDYETDVRNAKKRGYEAPLPPDERPALWRAIALWCAPFVLILPFTNLPALICLLGFLFFSLFYSAPPIRAKGKPILDSVFNVLYIFPGAMAYFVTGGTNFSIPLFFAGWAWAMAMHAYSAVPDISADDDADVPTVATFLGGRATLIACWIFYLLAAILSFFALGWLAMILALVYSAMMALSLAKWKTSGENGVMSVYRVFPIVNAVAGASLWWFTVWQKPTFWPF